MTQVTHILSRLEQGDPAAAEDLLPLVYHELKELAAAKLANEKPGQTLQGTALVHEAYLRLVGCDQMQSWNGKGHFFGAAAEAMRRILVENARRKQRIRHGGQHNRVNFEEPPATADDARLLALDEALGRLAAEDPLAARIVDLRRFAGLNHDQVAAALGVTTYQARKKWTYARAWLHADLKNLG